VAVAPGSSSSFSLRLALLAVVLAGAGSSRGSASAADDVPSGGAPPAVAAPAIVPPEIVEDAQAIFPDDVLKEGIAGQVVMDVDIDDEGLVQRVLVKASPDPRLSWAALGAVTQMSFMPATQDGVSIPVRVEYKLAFTIDEVARERALGEDEARRLADSEETAPVNLRGRVLVGGERLSVPGAFVSVEGTELEAVTDEEGAFELRGVPEGTRTLRVEASGYLPGVILEDIRPNLVTEVNLFLVRRPGAQDETVVYERRTQREVTKRVLTHKELTRVPGTFGDAIRVVQRLPGVSRAPFGLGAVLVRGGSPEDTNILIDGHLTRILFHLGAGPSVLNTDLVEKLELYPGGQGARFGRAIAGAIDVVTRDPRTDTWSGRANIDLLQTGFRLEGPLPLTFLGERGPDEGGSPKIGFFVAGRTSYVAEVLNISDTVGRFVDLGVNNFTLAPRYSDYQAKLVWKLPHRQTLSLAFFGSHDDLDLALDASTLGPNAPSDVGITIGFHRLNPVWKMTSAEQNSDGTPRLRAWVSPAFETNYSENRFDASQFRLDVQRASLRAELELRPADGLGFLIGTDNTTAQFDSVTDVPVIMPNERLFPRPATSDPPRFLLQDSVLGTAWSVYAESDVRLGPLLVVAGGRADMWTYYDQVRTSFDPRLALRLNVLRDVTLKGSLGLYHQLAAPFELAQKFGNPDLPLEHGWQVSLGTEVQLTRSLDLDVQLFGRTADDLAEFVVSPAAFFASGAARIQPLGEQRVLGAELLLRQRLDKLFLPGGQPVGGFFGWIAYTLMKAEERSDAPVGIENAEESRWTPSAFDQTHILSVAASWETPVLPIVGSLELGGALRYVTGNPATLAQKGIFDADTSRHQRVNVPFRSVRLPPFFQLDLRIDKRFTFETWSLGVYCDLQNATNQQNFEFFQYSYDFSQVAGFPGLPIIPVIGADASF
jgi:TonB family protein